MPLLKHLWIRNLNESIKRNIRLFSPNISVFNNDILTTNAEWELTNTESACWSTIRNIWWLWCIFGACLDVQLKFRATDVMKAVYVYRHETPLLTSSFLHLLVHNFIIAYITFLSWVLPLNRDSTQALFAMRATRSGLNSSTIFGYSRSRDLNSVLADFTDILMCTRTKTYYNKKPIKVS